ncbi:MAG: prepilin-type N-terminal cleavage/methylation domain-containing protein [Acidobacteria bacterium]|nr:prepilin-type N-terminal cleavage/methylation domain-containing protein [Acidobacteriota bacterium]
MRLKSRESGFSLIEMMIVMFIFLIISGAIFGLLNTAQIRYRAEQQLLDSLQGARVGIDQVTRDVRRAGYPPLNAYDTIVANPPNNWVLNGVETWRLAVPLVGYRAGIGIDQTCIVDAANPALSTCTIPGPFELVVETDLEPNGTVDWVYYRLDTPGNAVAHPPTGGGAFTRTFYRAVMVKACDGPPWVPMQCTNGNPVADSGVPIVENVMQDPAVALDPTANPAVFSYVCAGGAPICTPENIVEVLIVLQVRAITPDIQTRQVRAVTMQSLARVMNPPQ